MADLQRDRTTESFDSLFRTLHSQVVRIAFRVLGELGASQDVAQEVFLSAYGRFAQLSDPAAWIRSAAVHCALNRLREGRRRTRREQREVPVDVVADPEELALRGEERQRVRSTLARLDPEKAAVLVLRHSGLSYLEVADALGLSPGSVGTTLRRAEEQFRREWER